MNFRPCIDLHNGKVKQIIGSTLNKNDSEVIENFISEHDAAYYAKLYKESALTGGHVIKLGSGNETEALKALAAYPGGLQLGGGVKLENAVSYLEAGASHVIVTSYVFKDGKINFDNLTALVNEIGKEKLVLDLSCRKKGDDYYVVTDKWQKFTDFKINKSSLNELEAYCDEFLIHAADVEGKCRGIEQELVKKLGEWITIPATYAGGVHSLDDLGLVERLGGDKIDITVGSALDIFGGSLKYFDVVSFCMN